MTGICPCCRQATADNDALLISADAGAASRLGLIVHMEPQWTKILQALQGAYPGTCRTGALIHAIWLYDEPDAAVSAIKVQLCRLRRAVAPLGVEIENVNRIGWRLKLYPHALALPPIKERPGRSRRPLILPGTLRGAA